MHLAFFERRAVIDGALDLLPTGARHRTDLVCWQPTILFRRPENLPVDFGA